MALSFSPLILMVTLVTGLLLGAIYALAAAGVTLMFGTMSLPNVAGGHFFILAPLLVWSLITVAGLSPILAAILVLVFTIPLSWLQEVLLIRRFYGLREPSTAYFIITLGLVQIMTGIFTNTWGQWSDQYRVPMLVGSVQLGPLSLPTNRLVALVLALLLLALLFTALRFHRYGRALRAVFQNRESAALRGVNVRRVYLGAFILGMEMICAAGILYAMAYSIDFSVAWAMGVIAFAIMIIGGPGSVLGTFVVGMVFGFTQAIVSLFASPTVATLSYLIVMLLVLLFRPTGLFTR